MPSGKRGRGLRGADKCRAAGPGARSRGRHAVAAPMPRKQAPVPVWGDRAGSAPRRRPGAHLLLLARPHAFRSRVASSDRDSNRGDSRNPESPSDAAPRSIASTVVAPSMVGVEGEATTCGKNACRVSGQGTAARSGGPRDTRPDGTASHARAQLRGLGDMGGGGRSASWAARAARGPGEGGPGRLFDGNGDGGTARAVPDGPFPLFPWMRGQRMWGRGAVAIRGISGATAPHRNRKMKGPGRVGGLARVRLDGSPAGGSLGESSSSCVSPVAMGTLRQGPGSTHGPASCRPLGPTWVRRLTPLVAVSRPPPSPLLARIQNQLSSSPPEGPGPGELA